MDRKRLDSMRVHYATELFDFEHCQHDPIHQFQHWFDQVLASELIEPNAMTLATVNDNGHPSARIVLLKEFSEKGFVFFTNYASHKGDQMTANPNVALVFGWLELFRQVRIEGVVSKISKDESEQYFKSRPKGSQIGAWASPQSKTIISRAEIEENERIITEKYAGHDTLPIPPHWGGYIVEPSCIEFWQGRPNRLHDRILYTKKDNTWNLSRLAP